MQALISPDWTFALWGVLFTIAGLGFWVDTTAFGKRVSGIGLVMIAAMILSNLGLVPMSAPTYNAIFTYLVPVAIPLLLYKANLRRVIPETGGMLAAYLFGVMGTVLGVVVSFYLLPLGEWAPQLAGVMASTYIGGSMNFVAVGTMLEVDEAVLTAGAAADNVMGTLYLVALAVMPTLLVLRRWLPSKIADAAEAGEHTATGGFADGATINLVHIAFGLALSLVICALSTWMATLLGVANYAILFITVITVAIANIFHDAMARLTGHLEVGMLLMYVFFVVIGLGADIRAMIDSAMWVALLALITISSHLVVILVASKLCKLDLAEVIIASNACVAGPPTAAAMAAGRGWNTLVTPGVLCGTFGYVIASFLGIFIAGLLA
ncbi:DUF819 family protein [Exilibacterium tricleocarpae]|uniref:DUF819 family protein n=1 Tax=Exilibacterium tricleocarpae TaxID=2591008 RepID=A0A545SZX8_9GAMM|nr:DUF819 family protein [Exilibacterium tricleocarpae]TQV70525.1 DUF819 family protein [Exilibacterium tricleocarpae]